MGRKARTLTVMAAVPVLFGAVLTTPAAEAWVIQSKDYSYTYTDSRWVTTVGPSSQVVSGQDSISHTTFVCASHAFEYKRHRTLQPSQVLISNGLTTNPTCGWRTRSAWLSNYGTSSVFGNFRARNTTALATTNIAG